jgi:hypothetical protein
MDRLSIGTLHGYRSLEETLPEGEEGRYDFDLDIRGPLQVPADAYAMLTDPARLPRSAAITLDKLDAAPNPDGSWTVQSLTGRIRRKVDNVLVFSMCMGEPAMVSPWRDYTSNWQVPSEAAQQMAAAIARELEQGIRAALRGPALQASPKAPRPAVRFTAGPMIYGKRRITFGPKTPLTADSLTREMFRMPFIKPSAQASEREFRFVFEVLVGRRVYSPGKDAMFIASAPLVPFLVQ